MTDEEIAVIRGRVTKIRAFAWGDVLMLAEDAVTLLIEVERLRARENELKAVIVTGALR